MQKVCAGKYNAGESFYLHSKVRGPKQEWEWRTNKVEIVEEVPLVVGNQPLYRIKYSDGARGTAWEKMLCSKATPPIS